MDRKRSRERRDSLSPSRKRHRSDYYERERYSPRDRYDREERREKHSSRDKKDREKRKQEKKEKKERKKQKKEKKRKLKELRKQAENMLSAEEPPRGYPPDEKLSVDENYYSHNKEFRYWLKHTNRPIWDDLDNKEARVLFQTFTEYWNDGKLSERYYSGNPQSYTKPKHNWNIKDSSSSPSKKSYGDDYKDVRKPRDQFEIEEEREALRRERKRFNKHNDYIMDELVPKATGREAMIEKKKQRAAYTKAVEKQGDRTYSDDFLMGEDNEYQRLLHKSKQKNYERNEKDVQRRERLDGLRAQHNAKEQAILDRFKSVVESGDIPLLKYKNQ